MEFLEGLLTVSLHISSHDFPAANPLEQGWQEQDLLLFPFLEDGVLVIAMTSSVHWEGKAVPHISSQGEGQGK